MNMDPRVSVIVISKDLNTGEKETSEIEIDTMQIGAITRPIPGEDYGSCVLQGISVQVIAGHNRLYAVWREMQRIRTLTTNN